ELKHQGTGAAQKPSHTLRIDAEGEIDAERALLTLRLDVTTLDEQWTQIPLQLAGTILQEPPTYEGTGQHFLGTAPVGDGYQLWVQGPGPHQITLRVVTPVTRVGEERRLRIAFP